MARPSASLRDKRPSESQPRIKKADVVEAGRDRRAGIGAGPISSEPKEVESKLHELLVHIRRTQEMPLDTKWSMAFDASEGSGKKA